LRGPRYPPLRHWLIAGALAFLFALPLAAASQRVDLDRDWQFRTDPGDGLTLGWISTIPSATEMYGSRSPVLFGSTIRVFGAPTTSWLRWQLTAMTVV
jgi:hypothetical protein